MEALTAAAAGLVVSAATHVLSLRLGLDSLRAYAVCFLNGLLVAITAAGFSTANLGPPVTSFLLFICWWFIFLCFVNTGETSLRVRILRELLAANGPVPKHEFIERYNDKSLIYIRLSRLIRGGAIIERDGHFFVISFTLRILARYSRLLKLIILGQHSEFA